MVNHTGAQGPLHGTQAHEKKTKKPFGFWDFLLPAILGTVVFGGLSLALLTVGPRAMSLSTYLGGATVIVLLLTAVMLFVGPIAMLFIMPKTGVMMMCVFWPVDAFLIGLAVWVMTHVSFPV